MNVKPMQPVRLRAFLWDAFLQIGLGVVWMPLFAATVVHDMRVEWIERRAKARNQK